MKSDKSMISEGLKSMKNKKEKTKEKEIPMCAPMKSKYPWGLCIDLDDDSMKHLGLSVDKFSVNDEVVCVVKCKVKSISSNEGDYDDEPKESVELQITDMKIETSDD